MPSATAVNRAQRSSGAGPRRVLITGSRGFLGRHLVARAAQHGWSALGLHRGPDGNSPDSAAPSVRVDLALPGDEPRLLEAVQRVDAVIHAAAAVRFGGRRRALIEENVDTTARVVRACEAAGAPPLVFLSSASVLFRPGAQLGLAEDAPLPRRALSGYSASKARSEEVVRSYRGRAVLLRPQAIVGAGDRVLVPGILDAVRRGPWAWIGPRDVHIDLVAVQDVVRWCFAALDAEVARGVYHLSAGDPRPLEPLVRRVAQSAGVELGSFRVPRPVAAGLGAAVEGALALVAPRREPPFTRFAAELFGATRTLDPRRAHGDLGPPETRLDDALEQALHAPPC